MQDTRLPSLAHIREARERISPYVRVTPIALDENLSYKLEFLQHTGSFKVRGAFNAALQLGAAARSRGVVAVSGGNHGLAVAYAGRELGIPATLFMPQTTPDYISDRARKLGAEVRLAETIASAFVQSEQLASEQGLTFLHPFDNVDVIAGQGTIGLEILEQDPSVRRLIVSIGGGGLICGIASAIKQLRPDIRVIGVETQGADAMHRALAAGRIVTLDGITSIARTLGAPAVSERTLEGVKRFVDDVVVVSDADAVAAILELQERLGITAEPAAACTLAALRTGLVPREPETLALMCGRNVRLEEIAQWKERFETTPSR